VIARLPDSLWLGALAALAGCVLVALASAIAYFGRDPRRKIISAPNSILSAADGWISVVRKLTYDDLLRQMGIDDLKEAILAADWNRMSSFWLISVFMSVMDVHVNRAPLSGIVTAIVHRPGEFRPLSETETESQRKNERNAMFIQGEDLSVAIVQIAGMLARRIVCGVSVGDAVKQSDRLGCIRLGSQVDVIFPANDDLTVEVQRHRKVRAGINPLASFNNPRESRASVLGEAVDESKISRLVAIVLERWLNSTLMAYLYARLGARSIVRFLVRPTVTSEGD
jgi:phosphatidylserine decarboxylase